MSGLVLLLVSLNVMAETVYVSDKLRVGVRPEPDNSYTPVAVVQTGMELTVLDRQNGYLKIESANGITGWIKEIYAVQQKPAILKLQNLEKENTELATELKSQQETINTLEAANKTLNESMDSLKREHSRLQLLQARSRASQEQSGSTWYWWVLLSALIGVGGFVAGMQWHRQQTMKRLGGLRF